MSRLLLRRHILYSCGLIEDSWSLSTSSELELCEVNEDMLERGTRDLEVSDLALLNKSVHDQEKIAEFPVRIFLGLLAWCFNLENDFALILIALIL